MMNGKTIRIEEDLVLDAERVILNPDNDFFIEYLKPYYVQTTDGQYLFACTQPGRRPDRAFYMVPEGYKLGKRQQPFDREIGKRFYAVVKRYLTTVPTILLRSVQGEVGYETGLGILFSIENPHSAYIAWMGKQMTFPPKTSVEINCHNYVVSETLPDEYVAEIRTFWPDYDPKEPITLYDFTNMDDGIRRVVSVGVDYFGGAYKKPNLTMVWNRAEADGLVTYHAGCTSSRVLKGLSGTGKTTLTVGLDLEQDDACLGKPVRTQDGTVEKMQLIGLEAASFAKSEGLRDDSPEWPGLMKSAQVDPDGKRAIVLAMNIDCEGVEYRMENINGFDVKVPRVIQGETAGSLQCTRYTASGTTNGRFIFLFSALNPNWGSNKIKWMTTESLSFKRFDVVEPIFRVTDPSMAAALDSACESIITSAIAKQKTGTRVRSYAATDFMVREQAQQTLLKLKIYRDMNLGMGGSLVFFICNSGFVGEFDIAGNQVLLQDAAGNPIPKVDSSTGETERNEKGEIRYQGQGEKVSVNDSKTLVSLVENRQIEKWLEHPIYGPAYLIPDPTELEEVHGLKDFRKRFNPLRFYTPEQLIAFAERDIEERTAYLENLFKGQEGEDELKLVIDVWRKCRIPSPQELKEFYVKHYGEPEA
jgi:hypothetical protein